MGMGHREVGGQRSKGAKGTASFMLCRARGRWRCIKEAAAYWKRATEIGVSILHYIDTPIRSVQCPASLSQVSRLVAAAVLATHRDTVADRGIGRDAP